MTRDDMTKHIATYYVPKNMVLSVAGNTTHDEVLTMARKLLDGFAGGTPPPVPVAKNGRPKEHVKVEAREIAQSNIAMALHAVSRRDPDRYPAMILNAVLGRGMSSRLFKEVRERRGLAYAIGSGRGGRQEPRGVGTHGG